MEADIAFDKATAERGLDGWVSWFAEDATLFPQQGIAAGRKAIREASAPLFADPRSRLTWRPTSAVVSGSGDLAYTLGRWEIIGTDATGEESAGGGGNYVTIWRRGQDGTWKVAVDIGNTDPPSSDTEH